MLDLTPSGNLLIQVFTNFDPSVFSPLVGQVQVLGKSQIILPFIKPVA